MPASEKNFDSDFPDRADRTPLGSMRLAQRDKLRRLLDQHASVGEMLAVLLIDVERRDAVNVTQTLTLPLARVRELHRSARVKIKRDERQASRFRNIDKTLRRQKTMKSVRIRCGKCFEKSTIQPGDPYVCSYCTAPIRPPHKTARGMKGKL